MIKCTPQVPPSSPASTQGTKENATKQHTKRKRTLKEALKIIEKFVNKLSPVEITTIQAARSANRNLTPEEIKVLTPSAYDALTEEQITARKAVIGSNNSRFNIYDREIARGQLVANLPASLAKLHKAILYKETRFSQSHVRCRGTDGYSGRLNCSGSMAGMGQLAMVHHVDNPQTNPNRYGLEQLEDVLELNIEVSARVVLAGNARGQGLNETAKFYKYPSTELLEYRRARTIYSNDLRLKYKTLYGVYPYPADPVP